MPIRRRWRHIGLMTSLVDISGDLSTTATFLQLLFTTRTHVLDECMLRQCVTPPTKSLVKNEQKPHEDWYWQPPGPSRTSHRTVLKETSSVHYLLPVKCDLNTMNRLRHAKHLNYHKHERRDLEVRLFHTVLLITNSSYVSSLYFFSYLLHVHFNFFSHYFFALVYNPALAAIPK